MGVDVAPGAAWHDSVRPRRIGRSPTYPERLGDEARSGLAVPPSCLILSCRRSRVAAVTTTEGLDQWWSRTSRGTPGEGTEFTLDFGPGYEWKAVLRVYRPNEEAEWELTAADADWRGTRVGFHLEDRDGTTHLRFRHTGWRETDQHYRTSCYCWAMYLRVLRRYLEHGETVPYEHRLDV